MHTDTYRVYKGEEYYGRNVDYLNKLVLWCNICGYVGTYNNLSELEIAKNDHNKLHEVSK